MVKKGIRTLRTSVTVKSLAFLILLTTGILVCMEVVTFSSARQVEKQTIENYYESIQIYCDYWNEKLKIVNSSMLQLTFNTNDDMSYWNVCNSEKTLEFETGKTMLLNSLSEIASAHQDKLQLFCYVPQRNVYIKSINHLVERTERNQLDERIQSYIMTKQAPNSSAWDWFVCGGEFYFINVFAADTGYVGAVTPCRILLEGLSREEGIISEIVLKNMDGTEVVILGDQKKEEENVYPFVIKMSNLQNEIAVKVLQERFLTDRNMLYIMSFATLIVGLVLLIGNIIFQMKFVLGPLNKLRRAMEQFSQGNFDTHLPVKHKNTEINMLYRTFNEMIEQIANLKIQVYESKLIQERIQTNYMRVQIQPHFYTNILTLIYGLAHVQNYEAIKKLTMTTGGYFRYLLGEKGTFVVLQEELNCVKNYVEIQKIRYKDSIEFEMHVESGLENQMVLPMILQTFVGNSIKHNVTLVPLLHVEIRIFQKDEMLWFEIEDNGVGFDETILKQINEGRGISQDGKHIGIMNVKERLKLLYKDQASVLIHSKRGETIVRVMFRELITKEEKDEYYTGR